MSVMENQKVDYKTGLILKRARQTVSEPDAWTQGETGYEFGHRPVCLMGHVADAAWANKNCAGQRGYESVRQLIVKKVGVQPTWWNDRPGRTQEEVVEMLDELIEEYVDPNAWRAYR